MSAVTTRFPIPRPTEAAALGTVRPRPVPALAGLLWDYSGTEARQDREGSALLVALIARATRREAQS